MENIDILEKTINETISNITFDKEVAQKVDNCLKTAEKQLNDKLLHLEKTIEFNDSEPEFGTGEGGNPKFQLVPNDWWSDRYYGKTWKVTRNYETLSFKKSKDGFKFYYSRISEEISLGVEELEGTHWYYCVDSKVTHEEDIPVTGASISIKIKCFKELNRLLEEINLEVSDLPF